MAFRALQPAPVEPGAAATQQAAASTASTGAGAAAASGAQMQHVEDDEGGAAAAARQLSGENIATELDVAGQERGAVPDTAQNAGQG